MLVFISTQVRLAEQSSLKVKFAEGASTNSQVVIGETSTVTVNVICDDCSDSKSISVHLNAKLDVANIVDLVIPTALTLKSSTTSLPISFTGKVPGVVVVSLLIRTQDESVKMTNDLIHRIRVGKYKSAEYLSSILGWIYVLVWNVSSYPQLIKNFRRKSIVGVHLDYLCYNTIGHSFYTLYNFAMYFWPVVQNEYRRRHPMSQSPVEFNDLFFPAHAALCCYTMVIQACFYERGKQTVSNMCKMVSAGILVVALWKVNSAICSSLPWLDVIYYLSAVKLIITLLKYFPQALLIYRRKSTHGWAITATILDLMGGVFSLAQMFLLAYNHDDWSTLSGNMAKLGLGLFSVMFDVIFSIQHFILYGNHRREDKRALLNEL